MNISQALASIGLTSSESALYRYLLEHGVSSPPDMSRTLKTARSNIHYILKDLVEKGLVTKQTKGKRFVYIAQDPAATLALIERHKKVLEEALPDLRALYKAQKNKPTIKFYDGTEEMRLIFEEVLETRSKQVCGFASTERLFDIMPEYLYKRFQPELKRREIFLKDILTHESGLTAARSAKAVIGAYYDYRLLPEKYKGILSDVLVWDDNVAVLALDAPLFGTLINNADLARTFKVILEIVWKSLGDGTRLS